MKYIHFYLRFHFISLAISLHVFFSNLISLNILHTRSRKDTHTFQLTAQSYTTALSHMMLWMFHRDGCLTIEGRCCSKLSSCSVYATPQTCCRRFVSTALFKIISVVINASRMQQMSMPNR